jgi:peroxiredoxin Q/BCP
MIDQTVDDFSLPATGGRTFTLSACRGSLVVLYFYPKDSTPGCTTEAQQFRDLSPAVRRGRRHRRRRLA